MTSSVFTTSSSLVSETAYGVEDPFLDHTDYVSSTANSNLNHGPNISHNPPVIDPFSFNRQNRPDNQQQPALLRFSKTVRGCNVTVAPSGLTATRSPDTWSHGLICAIDADPLIPGRSVLLRLHQHAKDRPQALVGGLSIAAVDDYDRLFPQSSSSSPSKQSNRSNASPAHSQKSNNNKDRSADLPPYLCPDLEKRLGTGVWTESLSNDLLSDGCRLWICYSFDGNLHYFINNNYCGRLFAHYPDNSTNQSGGSQYVSVAQHFNRKTSIISVNNVLVKRHSVGKPPPQPAAELWLVFDLYGSTTGIELLATADGITSPNEIYIGGHDAILCYADACQSSGVLPETDIPLVFVGPAGSGKTTICNALGLGQSPLSSAQLDGTAFASCSSGLMKFAEQNQELATNNQLMGSLNLLDSEQWSGAYLCSETVRQRPKRKSKSQGVFLGGPKTSDHLLRMSVAAAQNLVLQALSKHEEENRSTPNSPIDKKSTPILDGDAFSGQLPDDASSSPRLTMYLPPNLVAVTPNDLLLLAQTMFDEIVLADESGLGGTTGVMPHASLVRSRSRASSTSSMRRRAGCASLSYRLCDLGSKAPVTYWLSHLTLLPKAIFIVPFDLTRIETNSTLIVRETTSASTTTMMMPSASPTSLYLDELSSWLELIYLRHSETSTHLSAPWNLPAGNCQADNDIFDQNNEPFLPTILLVGTRADKLANHHPVDTLRNIVTKLKYVADWFSGRPLFRHVVGLTAFVPTMVLPVSMTSCLGANAPILSSSTIPSLCSISLLRKTLEMLVRQQPTTKHFIPRRWVDLDDVVAELAAGGLTFLTTEQLRTLASDCAISTDCELAAYVRYAHSMGRLFYATATSSGHAAADNSLSDGIIFVNPHSLATVVGNSMASLIREHDGDMWSPPLQTEDRLHAIFQKQQQLMSELRSQTISQQQNNQLNVSTQQLDHQGHRQLRWVTWLLNKLDIATPWLAHPSSDSSLLQRKFVLMPLVPQKLSSHRESAAELLGLSSAGSPPLFSFYVDFKSQSTDFIYSLFLCRCLRWVVGRANQLHQQQQQLNSSSESPRNSDSSYSPATEQAKHGAIEFTASSWPHQLSRSVSYLRIDDLQTSPGAASSLVIVIANQIALYNRIKISIRALSNRTNEEPAGTIQLNTARSGYHSDSLQPETLHRTYSDSRTLARDAENSQAINQQAVLSVLNELRKCVLRVFGDLQTAHFHRLSFQLSVACHCQSLKCSLHEKYSCSHESCVHLISLSECLTNATVTCENEGRINTASIRDWFPSVVMPTCALDEDSEQSTILSENVLVETFDNIELHKGNLIPQWLKGAAKILNAENYDEENDNEDGSEEGRGSWIELARSLGYGEAAVQRFAEDVNPSLALLCDWVITAGNNQLAVDVLLSYLEQMNRHDVVDAVRATRRTPKSVQVFVSYQYDTQADVRALCEWLQFRGYTYWLDDAQMSAGDQLAVEIERAIRNCRVFLACLSPRYLVSQHCHREIWLADLLNKPIVPIVFEKIPWPPPGPLGLVLARLVYVDMKGVGGHGGGGLEADFLGRLSQVIDIVAGYMPHSASPNSRAQAQSGVLSILRARSQRNSAISARSVASHSQLIGTDGNGTVVGNALSVRVQSCTGCNLM